MASGSSATGRLADLGRGRAVRLALASPGCELSFGGLNYVVSYEMETYERLLRAGH